MTSLKQQFPVFIWFQQVNVWIKEKDKSTILPWLSAQVYSARWRLEMCQTSNVKNCEEQYISETPRTLDKSLNKLKRTTSAVFEHQVKTNSKCFAPRPLTGKSGPDLLLSYETSNRQQNLSQIGSHIKYGQNSTNALTFTWVNRWLGMEMFCWDGSYGVTRGREKPVTPQNPQKEANFIYSCFCCLFLLYPTLTQYNRKVTKCKTSGWKHKNSQGETWTECSIDNREQMQNNRQRVKYTKEWGTGGKINTTEIHWAMARGGTQEDKTGT